MWLIKKATNKKKNKINIRVEKSIKDKQENKKKVIKKQNVTNLEYKKDK